MKSRLTKVLSWAVFPALLVGGFAIAAPGDDGNASEDASEDTFELSAPRVEGVAFDEARARAAGGDHVFAFGHGPIGPEHGDLTYAEFHSLRDGEPVVSRIDRGTVEAVSEESLTIRHNDDTEVTIPVDSETEVLTPPDPADFPDPADGAPEPGDFPDREDLVGDVSDLEQGDEVTVHRDEGEPASVIGILPEGGEHAMVPLPPPLPGHPDVEPEEGARAIPVPPPGTNEENDG